MVLGQVTTPLDNSRAYTYFIVVIKLLKLCGYLLALALMAYNPFDIFGPWPRGNYFGALTWLWGVACIRDWGTTCPWINTHKGASIYNPPYQRKPRLRDWI